jgi:hypothetical protein
VTECTEACDGAGLLLIEYDLQGRALERPFTTDAIVNRVTVGGSGRLNLHLFTTSEMENTLSAVSERRLAQKPGCFRYGSLGGLCELSLRPRARGSVRGR